MSRELLSLLYGCIFKPHDLQHRLWMSNIMILAPEMETVYFIIYKVLWAVYNL